MKGLKLFVYYLILITAGIYGYFLGCEESAFSFCLLVLLCCYILDCLKGLINIRSISGLIEIIKLYLYLFIFVYGLYSLLSSNEWLWYIVWGLVLIGVYVDGRIKNWTFVIFIIFLILHIIIIYKGCMNTEILIIRDLFWYSLIMFSSFVWHVFILNWLYELMNFYILDYGCYVISRWSLLTSLTGLLWIIQWLRLVFSYYELYYNRYIYMVIRAILEVYVIL